MASCHADIFQVIMFATGTGTFLAGSRPRVTAVFQAQKNVFELHHSGVGEKQRRVVFGHQRRTGNQRVFLFREIF